MTQDDKLVEKKIYDIVLAARTEGIIGGKTKWLAKGDTDDILNTTLNDDVCSKCKGKGKLYTTSYDFQYDCPTCNGTGKKSVTIRQVIEEYLEGK